jgi:Fe-S cluster assembly protein SufD
MHHPAADSAPPPGWLVARQRRAAAQRTAFPHPTGREEAWRYTDVSLLRPEAFVSPAPALGQLGRWALEHWATAHDLPAQATLADGVPIQTALPAQAARAGVTLLPLDHAAAWRPDLVRGHLGTLIGAEDRFTARALAGYQGGLLLHVPRGVRLTEPLWLRHWLGTAGTYIATRLLVVVEADAVLTLGEDLAGEDLAAPTLLTPVVELFAGAGSRVTWQSWQELGAGTRHLAHMAARLERDAHLTTFHATFGADLSRTNLTVDHAGPGSDSTLLAAYFPTGHQHLEHWTVQHLRAPHARTELHYKGALSGAGHAVYYGTIRVGRDARDTDSRQTNRNLLLSDEARADSNPQLEIDACDVRCSHGSSVGRVNAEQLFYALSRGIPRPEAERMLVTGFLAEVADRLGDDQARQRLEGLVRAKLREGT